MQLQENIALAPYTTFNIGGLARFFIAVKTTDELAGALSFAKEKSLPVFVLGGGSNVLIPDEGFDGLVIKIEIKNGITVDGASVAASAGESWDELVAFCVERGLWGIENLSGIPGTLGGAVVQNIGAYGAALSQVLTLVAVYDRTHSQIKMLSVEECKFGYRGSIFKEEEGRYIVLAATLRLSSSPTPNISYKDLQTRFADSSIDIDAIRNAVLDIRKAKFPDLSVEGTAGSFFKNPLLSKSEADALSLQYPAMPFFPTPEASAVKIPIAWLMHHALHLHGMSEGGARLFEKQILVIVAQHHAPSGDVKKLAERVQKKVFEEFKIKIEPEVKIL
ncbi:UDP-N-acetylenolpyruvoylglucosamine reductase [Candidatus Adlerbacteria bacterium RIFOXYC1_FULL_48_26]|uniref:UDP-N-acetylenolpyruvoylglucosamine reductase n=1 Tax=Candidatus Adlerbacteria bacterium RIFOXYC1_FULL_48_26 TaxID=1797247 RepID=A0A1F4Y3R6_9BACT|nr:MAG: UDP-N-acetylenolpyruvoylglucosamine reductase [Candidatus Adlerbacteria bacterium RIFOXYC1_FULL_48_26]OGC94204.1 MAG: UDP-N-acetylenolpyruvoylglucosamine reductase [Candidatus Adlerbacteria bacterium RIFOXYB1_FULL_48_10]